MKQVKKKFILWAMLSICILLTALLSVINITSFTLAGNDADKILETLAGNRGAFSPVPATGGRQEFRPGEGFGPLGPGSPETEKSLRFFTFAFDDEGGAEKIAFEISAVSEAQAETWARSLVHSSSGWTKGTYRYRVYRFADKTYVTVIDQGRELVAAYRILVISLVGEVLCLLISFLVLRAVSDRLLSPMEEADRKQKKFIARAEEELKAPLSSIEESNETLQAELGENEHTKNISHQLRKLKKLAGKLDTLSLFEEELRKTETDLSAFLSQATETAVEKYKDRNLTVNRDIVPGLTIAGDAEKLQKFAGELTDNAFKFALTSVTIVLSRENGRTQLTVRNDTSLKNGNYEQVFDRFVRLPNADALPGAGLGLTYVKDAVKAHNGRVTAKVAEGEFQVKVIF